MKKFGAILLLLTFSLSCTKKTTEENNLKIDSRGKDHFTLLFSHNINGETHPCGCRQFPLGGIPQVAGLFHKEESIAPVIYVDTGDTFFPTFAIPKHLEKSLPFTAKKLAEAFGKLGLKFFVPGEADFAGGIDFLNDLALKHKFKILISNLSESSSIKASPWETLEFNNKIYAFIGVVEPELFVHMKGSHFTSPKEAIKKSLNEIKKKFEGQEIEFILLSHSGMDNDIMYADDFSEISWIVGSHNQSFLREPREQNKTNIVQVLSRNHYVGKISFTKTPTYTLLEATDEAKDLLPKNPHIAWLDSYKDELNKLQEEEQKYLFGTTVNTQKLTNTAKSCMQCHEAQTEFWQKTAHSLAYDTLVKSKAEFNRECIGCHTLQFNQESGFLHPKQVVAFEEDIEETKLEAHRDAYFKELTDSLKTMKSVRETSSADRVKYNKKWIELDEKHKVSHNFANVQCLNCHDNSNDHPFEFEKSHAKTDYQAKCITCHTGDQSPSWYEKDDKGIATTLNAEYFAKKLKEVSCPKFEMQ